MNEIVIEIPEGLLQGCHNCKWKANAKTCYDRDHKMWNCWENDGTFEEFLTNSEVNKCEK